MNNGAIFIFDERTQHILYFKHIHESTSFHYEEALDTKRPNNLYVMFSP